MLIQIFNRKGSYLLVQVERGQEYTGMVYFSDRIRAEREGTFIGV
jgi:hypothetical protein